MVSGSSEVSDCQLREQPFDNPEDEALYWKQIAEEYVQKLRDVRDEFDEFQEGSRELEAELEAQLEQYEKRVTELVSSKTKLEEENEMLRQKLETTERQTYTQITELQDENVQIKAVRDEMQKYIRELEQTNDDLERAKRATICSLDEFDARLNNAIERNAFLENELEEKEQLIITVQRLKDESRDLKGELALNSRKSNNTLNESKMRLEETQTNAADAESKKHSSKILDMSSESEMNKSNSSIGSITSNNIPLKNNGNPMTPSARISALNIVSDLLRKVGALESKLASCRNFVQEHPRNGKPPINGIHGIDPINDPSTVINGNSMNGKTNSNTNISGLVKVNV